MGSLYFVSSSENQSVVKNNHDWLDHLTANLTTKNKETTFTDEYNTFLKKYINYMYFPPTQKISLQNFGFDLQNNQTNINLTQNFELSLPSLSSFYFLLLWRGSTRLIHIKYLRTITD